MKRTAIVLCAAALTGCIGIEDFGEPNSAPDKKSQDYAACKLIAAEAQATHGSMLIMGDTYRSTMRTCMQSKGYASKE